MTEESKKQESKKPSKKNSKVRELEQKYEELNNDYLRLRADFDNFRKRKEKELEETRDRVLSNFVQELLPVIDNFEMSLKMTENQDMFIKGVEMIHKGLNDTLAEHKVESYEPELNTDFDPVHHDPVPVEQEDAEEGKVLAVVKKGYKHKENVIRPARVQVKKTE